MGGWVELSRESSNQAHNRYGVQSDRCFCFCFLNWVNERMGEGNSFLNLPFTFLIGLVHQGHAEATWREAPPRLPAPMSSKKVPRACRQEPNSVGGGGGGRGKKAPPPAVD